ncbi:two-component sensor histidine kinase [Povalibacter uvarum]|uniref:histidine kinase n=1 Tax=Povalibacter uvarum TaxID=732238 RepID=A0A841HI61_9GAMM|nr:histidine kinase dimerization/phosphoacceptor domain -containing protein [Povalibacter uvarum]MBB6092486.1 two-component sensor histidine kinase [Povalibacter uvarum]
MSTAATADLARQGIDLFVTEEEMHPAQRAPDFLAEAAEFRALSQILADDPLGALRRLLEGARRLCHAGSAGVSLLRHNAVGREIACWEVLSGMLAPYEGSGTPQVSTPCDLCLSTGKTILVSNPEQVHAQMRRIQPAIVETLVVPLHESLRMPLGTLWVTHHDRSSRFDAGDARILEQLGVQSVLALRLLAQSKERRYALVLFESHQKAQRELLLHELHLERSLRERAEESEREMLQTLELKQAVVQEAHHRVKNTLQIAASVLSLHARATASEEVRAALNESHERLQLLAKVHELLCSDVDSAESILMPQLLDAVGDSIRQSFPDASGRVTLLVATDPVRLPADEAIALALLANEAVTNAYKHAFPKGSGGRIAVTLCGSAESTLTLQIADDGVGIPEDPASSGMGLKIIRSFATQLRGALTISPTTDGLGTTIALRLRPTTPLHLRAASASG